MLASELSVQNMTDINFKSSVSAGALNVTWKTVICYRLLLAVSLANSQSNESDFWKRLTTLIPSGTRLTFKYNKQRAVWLWLLAL